MTDDKAWFDEFERLYDVVWSSSDKVIVFDSLTDSILMDIESASILMGADFSVEGQLTVNFGNSPEEKLRHLSLIDELKSKPLLLAGKAPERYDYQRHNRVRKKR